MTKLPLRLMHWTAICVGALLLASCGSESKSDPSGQVLATVDGEEITSADLALELGGLRANNATMQKQLESEALKTIINRVILSHEAKVQKLDATPAAATALRKAQQLALVELLTKKYQNVVADPSPEDVSQFVAEHPDSFAQRKIFLVDQIIIASPPANLVSELEPLDTMEQVQAVLQKYEISKQATVGVIDALEIDPKAAAQIAALPPRAVFMIPLGNTLRINVIRETDVAPLTGDAALAVAGKQLTEGQRQQQTVDAMGRLLNAGYQKVRYNPSYAPSSKKPVSTGSTGRNPDESSEN